MDELPNKTPYLLSLSGVKSRYTQRLKFTPTQDAEKSPHARLGQDKRTCEEITCNSQWTHTFDEEIENTFFICLVYQAIVEG